MGEIMDRKFAVTLLTEVVEHFGADDFQIESCDSLFKMFGVGSYEAVHFILENEGEMFAKDVQKYLYHIDDEDFYKVSEKYMRNMPELLSSLDFYRKCIMLSILALHLKSRGFESAPGHFVRRITILTGVAWSKGYVDINYDEARNFAWDIIEYIFKPCGLDITQYTTFKRLNIIPRMLIFQKYLRMIDNLIIENKWVTRNLENKNPKMNEKLFAEYFSYLLKLYKEQPPSTKSILELVVRVVYLCAHSVCNYYELSVNQALEYITLTMIFSIRKSILVYN